jgi:hypothetical protein
MDSRCFGQKRIIPIVMLVLNFSLSEDGDGDENEQGFSGGLFAA